MQTKAAPAPTGTADAVEKGEIYMQNMSNELQKLQTALKAYEQLAPYMNSIQQMPGISNAFNFNYPQYATAQAAFAKQMPSMEQAYKLYQQAYPVMKQLNKLHLPMMTMNQTSESGALAERLDELLKDMPKSKSDCEAMDKEKLLIKLIGMKEVLDSLGNIGLDESTSEIVGTLVAIMACIIFILRSKDAEPKCKS